MKTNDYRVMVKVRNNRIIKAIEKSGNSPGVKWCEANGLSYASVNNLINMLTSPVGKKGELTYTAERLCAVLGALPDELWSAEQVRPLERNFSELEMSEFQVRSLLSGTQQYVEDFDNFELKTKLIEAFAVLGEREANVLISRFVDEKTFSELSKEMGVSSSCVQQIERRAIGKIRREPRFHGLSAFLQEPHADCAI